VIIAAASLPERTDVPLRAAAATLAFVPVLLLANDTLSFALSVVRRDGVLVPFAAYHQGKWETPWPVPGKAAIIPLVLADVPDDWWWKVPPTATWTLWPAEGAARPVRATAPVRYPAQCLSGVGFKTDYKTDRPVPPPVERPFPKDGVATSGTTKIDRVEVLDNRAPEWDDFTRRIRQPFAYVERDAATDFSRWRHPLSHSERESRPVTIEALYRAKVPGAGEIYFVEASRSYEDPRQKDGCDLVTFVSGWIRPWKPDRQVFDLSAVVTYCDRAGVEFILPLGILRLESRPPAWIVQVASWDYERYVVVETGPNENKILVNAFGGSCPRPPPP
jgi:hypothetical protein